MNIFEKELLNYLSRIADSLEYIANRDNYLDLIAKNTEECANAISDLADEIGNGLSDDLWDEDDGLDKAIENGELAVEELTAIVNELRKRKAENDK